MKCPFCAEEIRNEAKKCRYCGEFITASDKLGYPRFYKRTTERGLTGNNLLLDYCEYILGDKAEGSCMSAGNTLGCIFGSCHSKEAKEIESEQMWQVMEAMWDRAKEAPKNSQEFHLLGAMACYLDTVRAFTHENDRRSDVTWLQDTIVSLERRFTGDRDTFSLEGSLRQELSDKAEWAIESCRQQLAQVKPTTPPAVNSPPQAASNVAPEAALPKQISNRHTATGTGCLPLIMCVFLPLVIAITYSLLT